VKRFVKQGVKQLHEKEMNVDGWMDGWMFRNMMIAKENALSLQIWWKEMPCHQTEQSADETG